MTPVCGSLPARATRVVIAGLTTSLLVTGCGGDEATGGPVASTPASDPPSSSSATSAPSTGDAGGPDLASGLLPAEAFGPRATVVAVSPDELRQNAGLAAATGDLQITPESCRAAVDGTQPDITEFEDIAAQSAITGSATTIEVLVRGGPVDDTVADLATAAQRCPEAQVSSPQVGQATVTFEDVPVDDLGDGAALLRYTTSLTAPDGSQVSVPTLVGAVRDGDRLLLLLGIDTGQESGTATDPAAFAELMTSAYEVQAEALG